MQIEVKEFGRGKNRKSTTSHAGKVIFTASNEVDAVQLAALGWAWSENSSPTLRQFREESLRKYCQEHGLVLHVNEEAKS